jgi:hypothetical protein
LTARAPDDALAPDELAQLLEQADAHAVLPAAMNNLPEWAREPTHEAALNSGLVRRRLAFSFVMMLRTHAEALLSAARGAPVALVKGRAFAATIYPEPRFRTYTDIDLLVDPSAISAINAILAEQGFRPADYDNDPKRLETKWISAADPSLMVEVHTNLVHHPGLREKISLTYDDFDGDFVSPASMLTIAAIHGALHQFERLQQAVDVRQAARALTSAKDEERFLRLITRCGGRLAAVVALELAERLFAEPRCREIRRSLGPERSSGLARLLLSPTTVVSVKSADRSLYSWRRNAVRELLKRRRRTP